MRILMNMKEKIKKYADLAMEKIKKYVNIIKEKVISLYSSRDTANYAAIATTAVALILLVAISIAIISNITGSDRPASATETSLSDIVMAEATSEQETTQASATEASTETATETETSTEPETSVPASTEPATEPKTIAIADLNIGKAEDSTEKYVDKGAVQKEFNSNPVSVTKPTTAAPLQQTPSSADINKNTRIVKGIDVSKWNSNATIDWNQVKASGVEFVIIRAGYRSQVGTSMYEDSRFKEHMNGALAAGLQVGVYFYSQATTEREALEEASYLLSLIKDYHITYPVCFDWEPVAGSRAAKARLSKSAATAIAKKFLSTVEAYGYDAMLYSYHSAIQDYFDMTQLSAYKTWVAWYYDEYKNNGRQYKVGELPPAESYPYQMWQYSSTGTVPGIKGNVDLNVAFYTYSENGSANSTIEFKLPLKAYVTNRGTSVDFITGVKAFDSAGFDMSSSITTTIKDTNGKSVSATDVFNYPGIYNITYKLKDFTGLSKKITAKLTVLNNLVIQLSEKKLTFSAGSSTYDDILTAVNNNVIAVTDDKGNKLDIAEMTVTGLENCYFYGSSSKNDKTDTGNMTEDTSSTDKPQEETTTANEQLLIPGSYNVTYTITDNIGSTATKNVTVNIIEENKSDSLQETSTQETTSGAEASDESISEDSSSEDSSSEDSSSEDNSSEDSSSGESSPEDSSSAKDKSSRDETTTTSTEAKK